MRSDSVRLRLDVDTHQPEARVAAWRAAFGFSHDIAVEPGQRAGFRASFDGHHFGSIMLADMRSSPHTAFRDRALIARHAFDYIAVDALVEGRMAGSFGKSRAVVEAGDCVLVDVCETMRIDVSDHRCLSLIVPRPLFAERVRRMGPVGGRLVKGGTPEARMITASLQHLLALAPIQAESVAEAAGLACLDLVAVCLGFGPRRPRTPQKRRSAPDLARVERLVARDFARPDLGPAHVAGLLGLSRSALYRLTAPAGGIATIIRRRRAVEARRLLASKAGYGLSVGEVARRCGFGEERALRRAMLEAHGASPREIRREGAPAADPEPPLDPRISAWVDAV